MITIRRSYPFQNFARWTWNFQDDSILISMRSLTAEHNRDVPYSSIKKIYHQRNVDFSNIDLAMRLVGVVLLGLLVNNFWHFFNPMVLLVAKTLIVLAIPLWIIGFKKHEHCMFVDDDNSPLVVLKINERNRAAVEKAIQVVKSNHPVPEYSYSEPLPIKEALFEIEEFDPLFYLTRRKFFFLPNNILRSSRSLVFDSLTSFEYSQLSGKVTSARLGNNAWDYIWCYWLYLLGTIATAVILLFPRFLYHNWYFLWALGVACALLIPVYLAKFVKRETWTLLDRGGEPYLSVKITPKNREKLEQISLFIADKVQQEKRELA